MDARRSTFTTLFIIMSLMLVLLPFLTSFQDALTRLIMHFEAYRTLQNFVVPYELKTLTTILNLINLPTRAGATYIDFIRAGRHEVIYLAWNCVGWQSVVFLVISLFSGLAGNYTVMTKFQSLILGLAGTYLINMFRLTIVVYVYYHTGRGVGIVFHDYFSNMLSIIWLFVYWWIAYTYVLEKKRGITPIKAD